MPDLATDFRLAAWQAYVGHSFRTGGAGTDAEITLDSAAACNCRPGFEQFSLSFVAPTGAALRSGMHVLLHPATGQRIQVYLEDVAATANLTHRFRADFNLIV